MKIGFTGTQKGMTTEQNMRLRQLLWSCVNHGIVAVAPEVHHGDCIGADAEFNNIAKNMGCEIVIHPASDVAENKRAHCLCNARMQDSPALKRNHDIVNTTDMLFACPGQDHEVLRSGTWATIRYARKMGKPVYIVYPDGTVD